MEPIPYFYDSINRSAIFIKAKQPFWDWLNYVDPEKPIHPPVDGTAYLVKYKEDNAALEKWLKRNFDKIFVNELNHWHTGEVDWPQKRTYKVFTEWFEVSAQARLLDTEDTEIE